MKAVINFLRKKDIRVCHKLCQRYYIGIEHGNVEYFFLKPTNLWLVTQRMLFVLLKFFTFNPQYYKTYTRILNQHTFLFENKRPLWFKRAKEFFLTLAGLRFHIKDEHMPDYYDRKVPLKNLQFKKVEAPLVSIIIPAHNQFKFTLNCLQSIYLNISHKYSYEVILVDDCSTDTTQELFSKVPGLNYIRNEQNLGFIRSCNKATKQAAGEFICMLNNDTLVLSGWLENLIQTLINNDNIGAVGSKGLFPFGLIQEAGGIVFKDASGAHYGRYCFSNDDKYNYPREVDYCSGSSLFFRKKDFEQLNYLDTQFVPAYFEDSDLCFSIRYTLNKKVVYQPNSALIHFEGISSGKKPKSGNAKSYMKTNLLKFHEKWKQKLTTNHNFSSEEEAISKYPRLNITNK